MPVMMQPMHGQIQGQIPGNLQVGAYGGMQNQMGNNLMPSQVNMPDTSNMRQSIMQTQGIIKDSKNISPKPEKT